MDTSGNLDTLIERVTEQARHEAAAIVERGGKAAARQIARAEEQRESRKQAAEAGLRVSAERRKHSAEAEAEQDRRRAVMNAREAAVDTVFAEALQALETPGEPEARRRLLAQLVQEGIRALGVSAVRVRLNAADRELALAPDFPMELGGVAVALDPDPIEASGGPVVADVSGRIVFENTFEARLDRMRESLRRLVAETLGLDREEEGAR